MERTLVGLSSRVIERLEDPLSCLRSIIKGVDTC